MLPVTDDNRTVRPAGELLRLIAAGTATSVGTAFLRSLAHHVVEAVDADVVTLAVGSRRRAVRDTDRARHGTVLGDPAWRLREDEPMVVRRFRRVDE